MKATNVILLASVIAIGGKWAKGQSIDKGMVVGGIFLAMIISMVDSANGPLANKFSWLILAAIIGSNGDAVFTALTKVIGAPVGATQPVRIGADGKPVAHNAPQAV